MAATIDLTVGGTTVIDSANLVKAYTVKRTVDCNASNAGGVERTAADTLQLINVPANHMALVVAYEIEVIEGDTCTFDIGDGSDPDGYHDGIDAESTGGAANSLVMAEAAPNTVVGYSGGKYYAAADTIDLLLNNNAVGTKITVIALLLDLSA